MRIAIVTPVFPPYRGGIGTVAAHDATLLRAHDCDVRVLTPAYKKNSMETPGVTRVLPWYAWGNAAVLTRLFSLLRDVDVIHLHYPFFGSDILVAFIATMRKIPLVVTYHMKPCAKGLLGFTFAVYRRVLQPIIFSVASMVCIASEEYAAAHGIRHKNIQALPFGVDTHRFSPGDCIAARERFGLPQGVSVIVFVGGLDDAHYFKGVDVLLRAIPLMKTTAHLLIVGDGNRRRIFEDMAKNVHHVHFAGSVPSADLPLAYRAADVHVLPSIDRSEAFGLVTEEAMASGIPSVVSNLPGVRSLVRHEETGLHVPPGDPSALAKALDYFCSDRNRAHEYGMRARRRAEMEYADEVLAHRMIALYRTLRHSV